MKKFKFRLEKVMDMRAEAERQRQMDLARAQIELVKEEDRLKELESKLSRERDAIEQMRQGERFNPYEMDCRYRYKKKIENDMSRQCVRIKEAKTKVVLRRNALLEAAKERKMLENLKSRQREAYLAEFARKEQALIDDVAITHFGNDRK
ncbi:flagellar export protein FliJ [bacterium]|nr:flagellar export protein FliJ [bacterium]